MDLLCLSGSNYMNTLLDKYTNRLGEITIVKPC